MPAITSLDLSNAKLDVDHIAAIATSISPTATDRLGHTKLTMQGAVDTIKAFNPRGSRVDGTVYNLKDLYTDGVITYVTVVTSFTSVSAASDLASGNVTIYQGVVFSDLSNKDGAKLVGINGTTIQDTLSGLAMQKAIKTSSTAPLSICPRVPAQGSLGFSVGIFLNVSTFANAPGIIGGLPGGLTLRFNTDGTIKVSKTAVVDIYTTIAAADTNRNMLVLFSRNDSGHNEISVNGVSFGTFEDSTSFTSDFFYVGTTDGLNSYISAEIGYIFISRSFISTTDAVRIINNGGLEYSDAKACWLASGDTHLGSSLVIPSLKGTGDNASLTPSTLVLPVSASIKNYVDKPNVLSNTTGTGPAYIVGDSQSKQYNASGSVVYTDTTTNLLKDEYQWTFKYAKQNNRDLQINNYAITGSGLNYTPGQAYTTVSPYWNPHLYRMGSINVEWSGQVVIVPGWNNIPDIVLNEGTAKTFRRSIEALIAKAYCRYSGALGVGGFYGNSYGSGAPIQGFSTSGTSADVTQDVYGTAISSTSNPFLSSGAPTNNLIRKINLAPTQYVEWDVLQVGDNGRYGIIVEATNGGSAYTVSVGGSVIITDSSITTLQGNWPQVNWIEKAPQGQKMRVTNTGSGNVLFLAVVFDGPDVVVALNRSIIVCSTTGNPTGRTPSQIQISGKLAEAAVSTFGDLGVKFCNLAAGWQKGDNDLQDPPHISPQGTDRIAARLMNVESVTHFLPSWCYAF